MQKCQTTAFIDGWSLFLYLENTAYFRLILFQENTVTILAATVENLKCQGISRDGLHIIFSAIVLSIVTYALPSFSGQLSIGDKERLDGLFRKAFKRGLCCHILKVDELINDADRKLFRQISHSLSPSPPASCPNKDHVAYSSPSEAEDTTTHCRTLWHIEFSLYKNSFVNRCLFNMI